MNSLGRNAIDFFAVRRARSDANVFCDGRASAGLYGAGDFGAGDLAADFERKRMILKLLAFGDDEDEDRRWPPRAAGEWRFDAFFDLEERGAAPLAERERLVDRRC